MKNKQNIGLFILVMFIVGSIDSLRNMPTAALFGSSLIFFFIVAAIGFLMPIALISAELSSYRSERNGVYQWVKEAFGHKTSMMAIWLQWVNTAIWFPTILSFIASGIAYLINPALAQNKLYVITVILVSFWGMTWLSLKDFSLSALFAALCAIFGFLIPFCVIATLLGVWFYQDNPVQIHVTLHSIIPQLSNVNNWISLTAVITAFLGMELAAVNIQNLKNPKRTYPLGVLFASLIILVTMIIGSLAIAYVIPASRISLIAGIFEMLKYYLNHFHLSWLVYVISALIVFSSLGEMINWIVSPARGLQQAAMNGSLPIKFRHLNENGMPSYVLITQAIIVTCVCLLFICFKSINNIYWLLTDLSTQLYLFMYVLMFLSAIKLHYKDRAIHKPFAIAGGTIGKWILCLMGIISSLIAITIGFIPPSALGFNTVQYSMMFGAGIVMLILPGLYFAFFRKQVVVSEQ